MSLHYVDVTGVEPVDEQLMYMVKWWNNGAPVAVYQQHAYTAALELLEWLKPHCVDEEVSKKISLFLTYVDLYE